MTMTPSTHLSIDQSPPSPAGTSRLNERLVLVIGCFVVLFYSGAFGLAISRGSSLTLAIFLGTGSSILFLLVLFRALTPAFLVRNLGFFAFFCLASVSVLWALNKESSIKQLILLTFSIGIGAFASEILGVARTIRILTISCLVALFLSALLALGIPSIGQSGLLPHHGNSWSGLFVHRSYLAAIAVVSMNLSLFHMCRRRRSLLLWLAFLFAASVLVLTQSKMSLIAGVFSCLTFMFLRFLQVPKLGYMKLSKGIVMVLLVSFFVGVPVTGAVVAPYVPELVGRETNLSGRTRFWRWGFHYTESRMIKGAGYRSFWQGTDVGLTIKKDKKWLSDEGQRGSPLSNGHNGYLDVYFELGLLGVVALVFFLGSYVVRMVSLVVSRTDPIVPMCGSIFVYMAIRNITETTLFKPDDIGWLLFIWGYFLLGKLNWDQR